MRTAPLEVATSAEKPRRFRPTSRVSHAYADRRRVANGDDPPERRPDALPTHRPTRRWHSDTEHRRARLRPTDIDLPRISKDGARSRIRRERVRDFHRYSGQGIRRR